MVVVNFGGRGGKQGTAEPAAREEEKEEEES